jgi:mRNA interferase HicA
MITRAKSTRIHAAACDTTAQVCRQPESQPPLRTRTFLSDNKAVRGSEFVRRILALGKARGIDVRWAAHRGKGSHGMLYYGAQLTTVRNLKDEIDKRAFHKMLAQLGLSAGDLE